MKRFFTLLFSLASALSVQAQTLVARFDFNNCSLTDSSVNGFLLSPAGSATTPVCTTGATGIANTARYFNGSNWYTTINSSALALNTWTISAVVKFRSFTTTGCQVNYVVASSGAQGSDSHYALETNDNNFDKSCAVSTPAKQQFFGMSRNAPPAFNSYPLEHFVDTNVWYCLTATFDGTDIRAYVDGNLIYTKTWTVPTPAYSSIPNPLLYIGTGFGGGQYYLNGSVDDVQVWSGVRGAAAISQTCRDIMTIPPGNVGINGSYLNPLDYGVGTPFPNPVNDKLSIPTNDLNGPVSIAIYTVDGRMLEQKHLNLTGKSSQLSISTEILSPGTYFLSVTAGANKVLKRFSKL